MALEKEQAVYAKELQTLLLSEGKFVLIHGNEVAGIFDSYTDALKIGYEKFGLEPFLVKQIQAVERVQFFTREFTPCLT
jgi:hypothetical protein